MIIPAPIRNVVEAARAWNRAVKAFRESGGLEKEDARRELSAASRRLERIVDGFEAILIIAKNRKGKTKVPWAAIFRGALKIAGAIDEGMSKAEGKRGVVEVEGEVLSASTKK